MVQLTHHIWLLENHSFDSVQSLNRVWLFVIPWAAARQTSLSIKNSQTFLKLMSIKLVMPSNHLILCCPILWPPDGKNWLNGKDPNTGKDWRQEEKWMTEDEITLTRQTFVSKVMSLLFNMSRFVIAFLTRSKCLSISWLQSPSMVILEPRKIKFVTLSIFPIYLPWSDGTRCHELMLSVKPAFSPLSCEYYTQFKQLFALKISSNVTAKKHWYER